MTPERLKELLADDEYHVLNILPEDFSELEKEMGNRAYTYRPAIGQLTIKMTTQMHGTVVGWAGKLINEGLGVGAFDNEDLDLISKGPLHRFTDQYENMTKVPNCTIVPGKRHWPTIAFEFGYAEPYEHLKAEVELLLEGSEGKIGTAIIIKLEPLREGETEIQRGFVEMWHYVNGRAERDGRKENLFPPPASHATQKLELTLGAILRDEFENLANEGWGRDDTIALHLDPLRGCIERATRRHLIQQGVLEE